MALPAKLLPFPSRVIPDNGPTGIVSPHLEGSAQTPRLDTQAALAPAQGVAKIGAGLQSAGDALSQLSQKIAEDDTITAEHQAALKMDKARYDIAEATAKEPDRSKWDGIADARLGQLGQEMKDLPNVPNRARELLDYKLAQFGVDVRGGLKVHAAQKAEADANASIGDVLDHAGATGDLALGRSTIAGAVKSKRMTESQALIANDILEKRVEAKVADDQIGMVLTASRINPAETLRQLDDDSSPLVQGMSPQTRARARNIAQQEMREGTVKAGDDLENRMALPATNPSAITTPEQVDDYARDNPNFTPKMAATAKHYLSLQKDAVFKQNMVTYGPQIASKLWTEVSNFDPQKNTRDEYYSLMQRIAQLPVGLRDAGVLLRQKMTGDTIKPNDPVMHYGEAVLTQYFKSGIFGAYDNNTKIKYEDVDEKTGKTVTKYKVDAVRNPRQYALALAAKSKMGGDFRQWRAVNPTATEDDAEKWIWKNQDDATLGGTYTILDQAVKIFTKAASAAGVPVQPANTLAPGDVIPGVRKNDKRGALPEGDAAPIDDGLLFPGADYLDEPEDKTAGGDAIEGFE